MEITDRQRAKLLELAAERGEKGFSRLVQEAIDLYLEKLESGRDRIEAARKILGTLDDESTEALRQSVRHVRERWR